MWEIPRHTIKQNALKSIFIFMRMKGSISEIHDGQVYLKIDTFGNNYCVNRTMWLLKAPVDGITWDGMGGDS